MGYLKLYQLKLSFDVSVDIMCQIHNSSTNNNNVPGLSMMLL